MHVVVIGGTRSIGPRVVKWLVEGGHNVTVYHRGISESALPDAVRHLHSPKAALPVLEFSPELLQPEPDVVLHMMAMGEHDARAAMHFFGVISVPRKRVFAGCP